jgi:sugar-phosphatase
VTDLALTNPLANRRFAAVLFDMDGTLLDSTTAVVRSWLRWAGEHGVDPVRLQGFHGVPSRQIVAAVVPGSDVDAAVARIDALELADVEGIVALPGAVRALAAVPNGRGAIVTSCSAGLATARIEASDLRAPDVLVTASDVERGKPDPEPYLLGAQRLGVPPADCLVVEDAPLGLVSARAAGMATLAVTTTTPVEELDADLVVDTLDDVSFVSTGDGVRVVRDR